MHTCRPPWAIPTADCCSFGRSSSPSAYPWSSRRHDWPGTSSDRHSRIKRVDRYPRVSYLREPRTVGSSPNVSRGVLIGYALSFSPAADGGVGGETGHAMTRLVKVLLVVASSAFLISCSSVSRHADRPAAQAYASVAQAHVTRVQADTSLDDLFATYGDSGQGWTGGDGGASVPLPDGRIFWAFSDTWAGQVLPNHLRPSNLPLLSNVAV